MFESQKTKKGKMSLHNCKVVPNLEANSVLEDLNREGTCIGNVLWWHKIIEEGVPLINEKNEETSEVTFLWRSDDSESKQNVSAVYIDINGITDHHSFHMEKLIKIEGTDVWFYRTEIRNTWRGSYSFIPVSQREIQPEYQGTLPEKKQQHRQWLRTIFSKSRRDRLSKNNLSHCPWGTKKSPLHMNRAINQNSWANFDNEQDFDVTKNKWLINWESELLNNTRKVWAYSTSNLQKYKPLPLVLILDGFFWSTSMPIFDALSKATEDGVIPEAVYVLIDEVNGQLRNDELACNERFWQAIQSELLPIIHQEFTISPMAKDTVVVGQSLGGLAAMYAALNWPDVFGAAVCQSGSFWWPDFSLIKPPSEYIAPDNPNLLSEMSHLVDRGLGEDSQLKLFIEVGSGEDIMIDLSQDMYRQLSKQNHEIYYRVFDGGHERLCWRGGIIDGLNYIFTR